MKLQRHRLISHRGWAHALLVLTLLANLVLSWHHYALADHATQETCHVCLASSAPGHAPAALPELPEDMQVQPAPAGGIVQNHPALRREPHPARAPPHVLA